MSKLFTVFGATGNQGGSVIRAIQGDSTLSKEFKIRGITRESSKPKAQQLAASGVEVVTADLASPESLKSALEGSHTVFLVTDFWATLSKDTEVAQGKAAVDAAKAANVSHLIFSSLIHVGKATNGRLSQISHFDGKAEIQEYITKLGIPATFFLPGMFMQGVRDMIKPSEDGEGYALYLPADGNKAKIPLVDPAADTGLFVLDLIKNFPADKGREILGANDYMTPVELLKVFSEVTGKPAEFHQISKDKFKSFLPAPVADELLENMLLFEDVGYYNGGDVKAGLRGLERQPTSWKTFLESHPMETAAAK